jgi:hypothetical protein
MTSTTNKTTDHDEIQRWVSEHDGSPAIVGDTRSGGSGVLRFDFPGGAGPDELEHVSWQEWFDVFEDKELALLYQVEKADGSDSTFFKLVQRE